MPSEKGAKASGYRGALVLDAVRATVKARATDWPAREGEQRQRRTHKTNKRTQNPAHTKWLPGKRSGPVEGLGVSARRAPREITGTSPTGAGGPITSPLPPQPFLIVPSQERHEPGLVAVLASTPKHASPDSRTGSEHACSTGPAQRRGTAGPSPSLDKLRSRLPRQGAGRCQKSRVGVCRGCGTRPLKA